MSWMYDWFLKYQQGFWYVQQARNELSKPLGLYQETALAILMLKAFGLNISWIQAVVAYVLGIAAFGIVGVYLTRKGVVAFNNQLANKQNIELTEILTIVRRLSRKPRCASPSDQPLQSSCTQLKTPSRPSGDCKSKVGPKIPYETLGSSRAQSLLRKSSNAR